MQAKRLDDSWEYLKKLLRFCEAHDALYATYFDPHSADRDRVTLDSNSEPLRTIQANYAVMGVTSKDLRSLAAAAVVKYRTSDPPYVGKVFNLQIQGLQLVLEALSLNISSARISALTRLLEQGVVTPFDFIDVFIEVKQLLADNYKEVGPFWNAEITAAVLDPAS